MINDFKLLNALLRTDLSSFIKRSFNIVNPAEEFIDNWHIDMLADYLTLIEKGEINRLIINIPPRSLKSVCISVAWPAWLLAHNPALRIIAASYSQTLSTRHSLDCKLLITSDWYQKLFPQMKLSRKLNQTQKFLTTQNGFRFATSVGGTITGDGGDFLIIDDPHKPSEIYSKKLRNKTIEWFEQTFATRLNNQKKGAIILVMQRLHPNDLSGHLLETQKDVWQHLTVPAMAQSRTKFYFLSNTKLDMCKLTSSGYFMNPNEPLHPHRLNNDQLQLLQQQIGIDTFAAQYLQQPPQHKAGMLHKKYISFYSKLPHNPATILQSWDTAIKITPKSDYSVCSTWFVEDGCYYLADLFRAKLTYPQLKKQTILLKDKFMPQTILIEDKASGQSLIQDLKQLGLQNIIAIKATKDKLMRFATTIPLFESGAILLPRSLENQLHIIDELTEFPNSSHDDVIDSVSQAINYLQYTPLRPQTPVIRNL